MRTSFIRGSIVGIVLVSLAGCASDDRELAAEDAGPVASPSRDAMIAPPLDGSTPTSIDSGAADAGATPRPSPATAWILANFAGVPVMSGAFDRRTLVETPALVRDATGTNAKYAFTPRDQQAPTDRRVAFVDVEIRDLESSDAFGGAIGTSNDDPGMVLFLSHVVIAPNWPRWVSYSETNYDGIVLDGAAAFYADDLTIENWNADAAIDSKAAVTQLARLTTRGSAHRTLRLWGEGPHYLVESELNNAQGSLLWFRDCSSVALYVYRSRFNGAATAAADDVECDRGSDPNIVYLNDDPRTTGRMHPMFGPT